MITSALVVTTNGHEGNNIKQYKFPLSRFLSRINIETGVFMCVEREEYAVRCAVSLSSDKRWYQHKMGHDLRDLQLITQMRLALCCSHKGALRLAKMGIEHTVTNKKIIHII
uniref:Uncharacterized protein n=1 Tax=Trypanosoma vivax (strain Y486) TaxID=1055687 RepID=G0UAL1_TRYVY|nr:hypothetical protein, unlikely [Trypanosoma vivax Y486]